MNLTSAINQAMDKSGGHLKAATQKLCDIIDRHPELRHQAAATNPSIPRATSIRDRPFVKPWIEKGKRWKGADPHTIAGRQLSTA